MNKITVEEYLREKTDVGEIIIFTDGGWKIGMTQIDHEDLFVQSLNKGLLNREVKKVRTEYRQLLTCIDLKFRVTVIEI